MFAHRLLNSDGDLPRHLRQGKDILASGHVARVDHFSYIREGQPYASFEYGSQVMLALANKAAGLPGVIALATLLIAATHALIARFLIRRQVDPVFAYGLTIGTALVAQVHWIARPHLFTVCFSVLLLDWLDRSKLPSPALFIGLFLLWANVHAGFLFGLTLIGLYTAGAVVDAWTNPTERPSHWRHARKLAGVLVLSGVATLVNAYGPSLHLHAVANLSDRYIIDNTTEFLSPDFHWVGMKFFLWALLGVIAGLAVARRPPTGPHLLVIVATIGFALVSQRNVTLFAVTGLPLAGLYLARLWHRLPFSARFRTPEVRAAATGMTWPWIGLASGALLVAAAAAHRAGGSDLFPAAFDSRIFPVEVVQAARAEGLPGRIFNEFNYGGYLQYAWPEQRVFVDGATDVYGGPRMRAYSTVVRLAPGWRDSLAAWRVDMVLLPTGAPMVSELVQDGTWQVWRCDATASLLRPASHLGPGGDQLGECLREHQVRR